MYDDTRLKMRRRERKAEICEIYDEVLEKKKGHAKKKFSGRELRSVEAGSRSGVLYEKQQSKNSTKKKETKIVNMRTSRAHTISSLCSNSAEDV